MQRVSGSRPDDDSWRADSLVGSRHSRWLDELRQPLDLHDRQRAAEICGQVARLALRDFAPALLLLPRADRQRLQAITAYALTLFDFARQSGLEGERLAAINRWEFDLESTLDGDPPGQPVYVLIHALEQHRPWNREGFDLLHVCARRRSLQRRPADRRSADREASLLGHSLAWLLLGSEPTDSSADLATALVQLRGLLDLGDDLRRHSARLPLAELPEEWEPGERGDPLILAAAIENECQRTRSRLDSREFLDQIPARLRPAARYARRVARSLVVDCQQLGHRLIATPPQIGLGRRLGWLVRSRWF